MAVLVDAEGRGVGANFIFPSPRHQKSLFHSLVPESINIHIFDQKSEGKKLHPLKLFLGLLGENDMEKNDIS
jgi:hypothetical protein